MIIQINLLPGANRRAPRSSAAQLGMLGDFAGRVKDPFLAGAVASLAVSLAVVALLFSTQGAQARTLADRQQKATADSARYAAVLADHKKAEARRDSMQRQLSIIRAIDNDRFVWPHVLDEVSRALPPYTWLASIAQTSTPPAPADVPGKADSTKKKDAKSRVDDLPTEAMKFRIVGNTVDIQALTRFMKQLEASPFIQNVTLAKSDLAQVDGKAVTQFQLDCQYQTPDSAAIRTVPVSLLVK